MSQVFFALFCSPPHTHFSICFPLGVVSRGSLWRRGVGGCVCVCARRARAVSQRFLESASALGRAGKDGEGERERKTCWQAVHRQLQTSGRPGECPKLLPTEGRKTQDGVKLIYAQMYSFFRGSNDIILLFLYLQKCLKVCGHHTHL